MVVYPKSTEALLAMAHLCGLTIVDLKAFHKTVPPFSQAKWTQVTCQFSLQVNKDVHQLGDSLYHAHSFCCLFIKKS